MKKVLIGSISLIAIICILNINLATHNKTIENQKIISLNKALADSESCIPDLPIPTDPGPDVPWPGYPDFPVQF